MSGVSPAALLCPGCLLGLEARVRPQTAVTYCNEVARIG
jgi:hypothetical protein